jgi:hypothetical protein
MTMKPLPRARRKGLITQPLPDELLVYDRDRHHAFCLNRTCALLWEHCDGRRTIADLMQVLREELDTPVDEEVVWFGLAQLEHTNLLLGPLPRRRVTPATTRRELFQRVGRVAVWLLPVIVTVAVPTAALAGNSGKLCCGLVNTNQACLNCIGPCGKNCNKSCGIHTGVCGGA